MTALRIVERQGLSPFRYAYVDAEIEARAASDRHVDRSPIAGILVDERGNRALPWLVIGLEKRARFASEIEARAHVKKFLAIKAAMQAFSIAGEQNYTMNLARPASPYASGQYSQGYVGHRGAVIRAAFTPQQIERYERQYRERSGLPDHTPLSIRIRAGRTTNDSSQLRIEEI